MRLHRRTIITVALLLLGSLLCLSWRHVKDAARAQALAGGSPAVLPPGMRDGVASGSPPSRRPSSSEAEVMTRRLRSLMSIDDPTARFRAVLALIEPMQSQDFALVLDTLLNLQIEEGSGEFHLVLSGWAHLDPAAAMQWASKSFSRQFSLMQIWCKSDPVAAFEWACRAHEPGKFDSRQIYALMGLAAVDRPRATAEMQKLTDPALRDRCLEALVGQVRPSGRATAQTWVDSLQPESLRTQAVIRISLDCGPSDCADRLYWLETYPAAASKVDLPNQYGFWLQQQPQGALDHFASLSPGPLKQAALEGMAAFAAKSGDPAQGLALMDSYPAGVTDTIVSGWISATAARDPALALGQLERLFTGEARDQACATALAVWLKSDPTAARDWLSRHDEIPAAVRHDLESR